VVFNTSLGGTSKFKDDVTPNLAEPMASQRAKAVKNIVHSLTRG
jgi:hypothetical protein